jgi:hypothetical protein
MFDCGDDPNSQCVSSDNFSNNWYILVHLRHLGCQPPNTIRLKCIEDCSSKQVKSLQKEDQGAFDHQYDHNGKCSSFGKIKCNRSTLDIGVLDYIGIH